MIQKPSIAFIIFGQNRIKNIDKLLKNIENSMSKLSDISYKIFDCTVNGIDNNQTINRLKLKSLNTKKELDQYDPLHSYRSSGPKKISGGMSRATIYLQNYDYYNACLLLNNYDYIFRLRIDIIIKERAIIEAIENVVNKDISDSPFKVLKSKIWVQFAHCLIPFYLHDTSFLASREDLLKISKIGLKDCENYPLVANPCHTWGPIFFKKSSIVSNYAEKFINEYNFKKLNINTYDYNKIIIYWKYLFTNFYIYYNNDISWVQQWNLKKSETRTWNFIKKEELKKLSIRQIVFLYTLGYDLIIEENLHNKEILQIARNKTFALKTNIQLLKLILKLLRYKLNKLRSKIL